MQTKDSEALQNQRRRRKRIGRIKNTIIAVTAGWILLSMILIIYLITKTVSLEHRLDLLLSKTEHEMTVVNDTEEMPEQENAATEKDTKQAAPQPETTEPPAAGIDDEANLAQEGDIHKVYLTFDNGPSENTAAILDILAEYGVKATFFVSGKEDEESKQLYQRIVEEGHTLGMRSYSNKYNVIYESEDAFKSDYQKLKDYLFELTGVECRYYRFPGGSSNQISNVPMSSLIQYLNEQQTVYFDWNVSAGDAASVAYTADEIVANVTEDVVKYKTSVVLLHDAVDKSATVEAIGPLIEALQNMNAEILPIDEEAQVIQYVKADSVE